MKTNIKQPKEKEAHDPAIFVCQSMLARPKATSLIPAASPLLRAPRLRRAMGPIVPPRCPTQSPVCARWREGLARPPNISPRCRTPTTARQREGLLGPADGLLISTPSGLPLDSLLLGWLCPLLWAKQKMGRSLGFISKGKKTALVRPFRASFVLMQPG